MKDVKERSNDVRNYLDRIRKGTNDGRKGGMGGKNIKGWNFFVRL